MPVPPVVPYPPPTPYSALQSQLFRVFSALAQCSAGFIDVALGGLWAFITSTLPRTWPLYLSFCLFPSRSAAPDPNGDPDAYAAAAAERACFLMDFWLMFWALLWVPVPAGPTSLTQLTFSCDVAWVMRPSSAGLIKVSTIEQPHSIAKIFYNMEQYIYFIQLYIRQWGSRCPSEARK